MNEKVNDLKIKAVKEINNLRNTLWDLQRELLNSDDCSNCSVKKEILELR